MRLKHKDEILPEILKYALAIVAVAVIGTFLIRLQNGSPLAAYGAILQGICGSASAVGNSIRWITPCIFTGIAATVAFKSGVMNLGIEGQLYTGAFVATVVGLYADLPAWLLPIACLLSGALAGLLYALIPAVIKLVFRIDEMITTLMLNYVAVWMTEYLTKVVKGISATNNYKAMATPLIQEEAELPRLIARTNASAGFFIAVVLVVVIFAVYRYTRAGYELKQVGANLRFARVGGVRTTRVFLSIFLLSGFIAGLCGAVEILGVYGKFAPRFASNIGWDGIMISMIAKNSPIGVGFVSVLWGALKAGALQMERVTSTNRLTIELIQALFVLFVTVNYKGLAQRIRDSRRRKQVKEDGVC